VHLFLQIHRDLPREAPGSSESTLKALAMIQSELPPSPSILDVGCGPGAQTVDLAKATGGRVTALDIHGPFLDDLRRRSRAAGVAERIEPVQESMFAMEFLDASFDLLWAEGSIYIFGFERGLVEWRHLLKSGGCFGLSELCWLTKNPPARARDFWEEQYPQMRSVDESLRIIRDLEYTLVGHFTLPERDWWEGYYGPLEKRIAELRSEHPDDPQWHEALAAEQEEIELLRACPGTYGYEFFVVRN